MNIIDCIDNNIFLKKIFPYGVHSFLVGQFALDQGQFSINIHIKSKPAIEILKWGTWGEHYDVIVFEMIGVGIRKIEINNWNGFDFAEATCTEQDNELTIELSGADWSFSISCLALTYQRGNTYIA